MIWVNVAYVVGVHLRRYSRACGLSVRIGKRLHTCPGLLLFFASATCSAAAATGLVSLVLGRFVEGFGKMMAMAVGRATLYKQFDRRCWWPSASTASSPTRRGTATPLVNGLYRRQSLLAVDVLGLRADRI